ncbi:hypothetical protein, partial [Paraburkholderia hiiakae]|uniref:hypothetical protein n=1 Tax=Paraburkholderia hiiakae TaxID=1081782 RepID=UPI001F37ACFD
FFSADCVKVMPIRSEMMGITLMPPSATVYNGRHEPLTGFLNCRMQLPGKPAPSRVPVTHRGIASPSRLNRNKRELKRKGIDSRAVESQG